MADLSDYRFQQLGKDDTHAFRELLSAFGRAFEDETTYAAKPPGDDYLKDLLNQDHIVALAVRQDDEIVGGLVAYELRKFEQERTEFYIYDLAVTEGHRRQGIATGLIEELKTLAAERGAYVIFVQADYGDDPAIALYSKLGKREDVLHFDILIA